MVNLTLDLPSTGLQGGSSQKFSSHTEARGISSLSLLGRGTWREITVISGETVTLPSREARWRSGKRHFAGERSPRDDSSGLPPPSPPAVAARFSADAPSRLQLPRIRAGWRRLQAARLHNLTEIVGLTPRRGAPRWTAHRRGEDSAFRAGTHSVTVQTHDKRDRHLSHSYLAARNSVFLFLFFFFKDYSIGFLREKEGGRNYVTELKKRFHLYF